MNQKNAFVSKKIFSEMLYENEQFKDRELAALVASKVYYHLGSFDNALLYALGAGKLFNVDESTEYVETIIGKHLNKIFFFSNEWYNVYFN